MALRWKMLAPLSIGAAALLGVSGCVSAESLPLPGGVNVGEKPIELTLEFDQVLDLVPQSLVKLDGVNVGSVSDIKLGRDGWTAEVTAKVRRDAKVPASLRAEVQQTNLLGEKFVALIPVGTDATAITDGTRIPLSQNRHATDVEEVLSVLATLLNQGGFAQIQPIVTELTTALGTGDQARALLEQTSTLIDGLNAQRDDIVAAIEGVNRLSQRANDQTTQIENVLDEIPEGVAVLAAQRPQFVAALEQLNRLGEVGTDVVGRSKDSLLAEIRALKPALQALTGAADDIIDVLPWILTFPFPDEGLAAVHGDSMNLHMSVDLRLLNQLEQLGVGAPDPQYTPPLTGPVPAVDPANPWYNGNGARYGWPSISLLPPAPNGTPGATTPPSGYPGGVATAPPVPNVPVPSSAAPSSSAPSSGAPAEPSPAPVNEGDQP